MPLTLQTEFPPLRVDDRGACRVGDSRVLLELVIHSFDAGATPETIVQQYPTTKLADIYAVIAYYLRHREDVAAYLRERDQLANEVRSRIEARQEDLQEIRARLLNRARAGAGPLSPYQPQGRGG